MAEKKQDRSELAYAVVVALLVAAFLIVPLALAVALWWFSVQFLGRKEYLVALTVGVLGWCLGGTVFAVDYGKWFFDMITGNFNLRDTPVLMILSTSVILASIMGLFSLSRFGSKLPAAMRPVGVQGGYDPFSDPGAPMVPDAGVQVRLQQAAPAGVFASQASDTIGTEQGKRRFPIGYGRDGSPVYLTEKEVGTHAVILGATGSGKSETIKNVAGALLDLGWSGTILDLKEDTAPGGLRDFCADYSLHHGLPFQELRLSDPNSRYWYNPFDGMGPDEIRDMILSTEKFDAAYWEAINREMLGQAISLMTYAHKVAPDKFAVPTLLSLGQLLQAGPKMGKASQEMRAIVLGAKLPGVHEKEFSVLASPDKAQGESAVGFGARFTSMFNTVAGKAVLTDDPSNPKRIVDVTAEGLTYIGLDSQGKADMTKMLSSSILQRMSVYAAMRVTGQVSKENSTPRFLIVDEANWVDRTITQNLLSRARSAKIAMFLCTQGPQDWIDKDGDDWGKLTQNTNVAIIMRQGSPESAKLCAEYIGTRVVDKETRQKRVQKGMFGFETDLTNGVESSSISEAEDYWVTPEQLRNLTIGQGIVKIGVPGRIEWAQIMMRDPKTGLM